MKKITSILIILFSVFAIILFAIFQWNKMEENDKTAATGVTNIIEKDPYSDMLSPITRQKAIDRVMWSFKNNIKDYQVFSVGDKSNIVVTYYQWETEIDSGKGSGILIFEVDGNIPKLIWENDHIPQYIPLVKAVDMTGDGRNELLVLWQNGRYETLYIYELKKNNFVLLTPKYQPWLEFGSQNYLEIFNARDGKNQVSDLDNDKLPEVWFPKTLSDDKGRSIGERYVAYKWDGTKYFLWKEQDKPFGEYNSFRDLK